MNVVLINIFDKKNKYATFVQIDTNAMTTFMWIINISLIIALLVKVWFSVLIFEVIDLSL